MLNWEDGTDSNASGDFQTFNRYKESEGKLRKTQTVTETQYKSYLGALSDYRLTR